MPDDREQPDDGWLIYRGTGEPHNGAHHLPPPPLWRAASGADRAHAPENRIRAYGLDRDKCDLVTAALRLRLPLLVTGRPGSGKTSLADSIAYELKLGPVLRWPITSRSTLTAGLYAYDAIGRLHDANLPPGAQDRREDIGCYFRLGPLGTALLPQDQPRVLLVDNLDRGDLALPDELLDVLEYGAFAIPELERLPSEQAEIDVYTADPDHRDRRVRLQRGQVQCRAFPLVIVTSNGERDFGPAFRQRCVSLKLDPPGKEQLAESVTTYLGPGFLERHEPLVKEVFDQAVLHGASVDRVLDTLYVVTSGDEPPGEKVRRRLRDELLRPSGAVGP